MACEEPNACGINAACVTKNNKKVCSCPASFTGNAEVECVRVPTTCASNAACGQGLTCQEGICMPTCKHDDDCSRNERCDQGKCMRKLII